MSARYFWVQLSNGPPWGFRLRGGKCNDAPLVIAMVNSKGRQQGLKEGDKVISLNGKSTSDMTHADAQKEMRESSGNLELQLERRTPSKEMNGTYNSYEIPHEECLNSPLKSLEEDNNQTNTWSTDSTSTGSTTIHVSQNTSEEISRSEEVWSPGKKRANLKLNIQGPNEPVENKTPSTKETAKEDKENEDTSPVWQPFGAPYDGPQFRPVKLGVKSPNIPQSNPSLNDTEADSKEAKDETPKEIPVQSKQLEASHPDEAKPNNDTSEKTESPGVPASSTFTKVGWSSHLPQYQSPTITLLQKAREGQLPKGAIYIDEKPDTTPIPKNAVLIDQKVTIEGDKLHTDSYYAVPTLTKDVTTVDIKTPPKYEGIGPTEYGIPVGLRTGVKEEYASDWYKTMYKSLHRNKYPEDKSQTYHLGGYMSEPELERKEKLQSKYLSTEHRRKPEKSVSYSTEAPLSPNKTNIIESQSSVIRSDPKQNKYRVEPRSIAEYEPGHSSLAEKEFQKHEYLGSSPKPQQGLARRWPNVLLTDGYESDSTLIRKTGRIPEVDPEQQKAWYKEIQKGGEIPFIGLRKSAPEKPTASPHQYQETEVNIHYRSPIRHLEKEYIEEEELRKRQEDAMRKFYEEERRKKQQQEMAEIEMRRHSDFFTPSQKSPIPLNRYDNPFDSNYNRLAPPGQYRGPPPKTMAKALYPFVSQTTRELSLCKGDIVYINKQIDKNWYEGEHHGLVGIFPVAYVEIIPNEKANLQPRKATEGEAMVKYNFRAQSPQELSLFKGEKVILTRKMDQNWYEGRLGVKKGIFPISYVDVLQEPGENYGTRSVSPKPPASPVYSPIINGSPKTYEGPTFNTGLRPLQNKPPLNMEKFENKSSLTQSLHIDTYNEPIPYKCLYSYKPQNDDELELKEGDTVYVMEKCDDGWYVGTSLRTGLFGTFPGNYVERI